MRPFLKWAGGKRLLLPHIYEFIDREIIDKKCFYEPFVGGGSVFLNLNPNKCVINDLNEELINVYRVIKDNPFELIELLKEHKELHNKEYYYMVRAYDRDEEKYKQMSNIEKAARTIYLNKTCYNGLYRVNRNGYFNTPVGRYVNPLICDEENILEVSSYLNKNKIKITSVDFEKAVKNARNGDFVYFDPPYDYETSGFVGYVKEGFNRDDLRRLKITCDSLIKRGCKVLISNNDTTFVRELFEEENYEIIYRTKTIKANRNINSKKTRNKVDEVLIYGKSK